MNKNLRRKGNNWIQENQTWISLFSGLKSMFNHSVLQFFQWLFIFPSMNKRTVEDCLHSVGPLFVIVGSEKKKKKKFKWNKKQWCCRPAENHPSADSLYVEQMTLVKNRPELLSVILSACYFLKCTFWSIRMSGCAWHFYKTTFELWRSFYFLVY